MVTFDKWFRVDMKPFKSNILDIIKKWSFMFKQHIMDDITNSLIEMQTFIKSKVKELAKEVVQGDYKHLVAMIGHLNDVREKTTKFDFIFEPIKKKIEFLSNYGQKCPEFVAEMLEVKKKKKFLSNFEQVEFLDYSEDTLEKI